MLNKMKPLLLFLLILINNPVKGNINSDVIDEIALHFKNANSKEVAKHFAQTVELIIIDQEDVYSKAQSEQILKDFFLKNAPQKIQVTQKLNNDPLYRFGSFYLYAKNSKFRVLITFSKQRNSNVFLISELRIERE